MEMIRPLLAVLLLFMVPADAGAADRPVWWALAGILAYLGLTWVLARRAARAHLLLAPGRFYRSSLAQQGLDLVLWALLLWYTPWISLAFELAHGLPVLGHALAFLPFVLQKIAWCEGVWPAEQATNRPWTRREFTLFHLRVLALPTVPILVLQSVADWMLQSTAGPLWLQAYSKLLLPLGMVALMVTVFALAPLLVRWILGAHSLPAGLLRTRLEGYCERVGFRPNDILVWRTGNTITNALYIGILPRLRYVVLTDALMTQLGDNEVEAVFAHEAGHGMRRHTQIYVVMVAGMVLLAHALQISVPAVVESATVGWLGVEVSQLLAGLMVLLLIMLTLGLFFLVGLGWLSRRFETEADLHAVATLGDADAFASALERVGLHLGMVRKNAGGLRHFGIGTRIGLINRYRCEPEFRVRFDRLLRRCRLGVLALLVVGVGAMASLSPGLLALGSAHHRFLLGQAAEDEDTGDARALYAEAALKAKETEGFITVRQEGLTLEIMALAALGDGQLKAGDYDAVRATLGRMEERVSTSDVIGRFNTRNLKIILQAVEGEIDLEAVQRLIGDLDALVGRPDTWHESVALTYSDLYLVLRAGGGTTAPPGRPSEYSAAARLLWTHETRPAASASRALLDAARRDVSRNRFRDALLHRAAPDLAGILEE